MRGLELARIGGEVEQMLDVPPADAGAAVVETVVGHGAASEMNERRARKIVWITGG